MPNETFASLHGFTSDPFASTNSETEELLTEYFVPPPYFASVLGDARTPKSKVVFAPRGSGKTAQRRMLEIASLDEAAPFVCLTYDTFDVSKGVALSLEAHLTALNKLLCIQLLEFLDQYPDRAAELDAHQKRVVKVASQALLGGMSESEYTRAFASVKSLGDKATEFWKKYGGVLAAGIAIALKKAGLDDVSIPAQMAAQAQDTTASAEYFFRELVNIVRGPFGGGSVYVLVDKVDETSKTSTKATAAWSLIEALLTNLPTLETPGVAFKFFLWDQLGPLFLENGGRPDRLQPVALSWTPDELEEMLRRRLRAYSGQRISSFNDLCEDSMSVDAHKLLAYLSAGSPRDMIRLAESVAEEHTRTDTSQRPISEDELLAGIRRFAEDKSSELAGRYLSDLQKVALPSFTINHLANRVFNVSGQAARSKVQKWIDAGVVKKIGELPNKKNKPLHLYGLTDPRVVIVANPRESVLELLGNYMHECPTCKQVTLTAEVEITCASCGASFPLSKARSLLEVVQVTNGS